MSAPSAPPITIRPRPYLSSIEFWWGPPANSGSSYISSYYLYRTDTSTTTNNQSIGSSFYTTMINRLAINSNFQYAITAINNDGLSSPSVAFRNVETGLVPGAPSTCYAYLESTTTTLVTFTQPNPPLEYQANIKWFVTSTQYANPSIPNTNFGSYRNQSNRWFTGLVPNAPVKFLVNCVNDPGYSLPNQSQWFWYPYAFANSNDLIVWADASQLNSTPGTPYSFWPNLATTNVANFTISTLGPSDDSRLSGVPPVISSNTLNTYPVMSYNPSQVMGVNPLMANFSNVLGTQLFSFFAVSRQTGSPQRVFGNRDGNAGYGYWNGQKIEYQNGTPYGLPAPGFTYSSPSSDSNWDIISITNVPLSNTTDLNMYWNGSTTYVSHYLGSGSLSDLTFNGYQNYAFETSACEIAEVIYYATGLNTTDRQKMEGYLAYKWGLQSNLPSEHPYRYEQA